MSPLPLNPSPVTEWFAQTFDEPTPAQLAAWPHIQAGRTVLIATQRLSTVQVADRAVVLDDGVIVESGTTEELLAAGALFSALFGEEVSAAA